MDQESRPIKADFASPDFPLPRRWRWNPGRGKTAPRSESPWTSRRAEWNV